MILFAAVGFAGYHFLGAKWMFPAALILGLVVAQAVPAKTTCAIAPPAGQESASEKERVADSG